DELNEPVESVELRMHLTGENPDDSSWDVIQAVLSHTLEHHEWRIAPDNREGVRILFNLDEGIDNAWFMLRKSIHDPVMSLNAESDVPNGVRRILNELLHLLETQEALEIDLEPLRKQLS
ncbi:MAG: phosphomannomutase/phosphoglucomutase, partial [Clostridia bacterium]|nr:phosphomannomutase/phosphoglucomutase [Clostridia bacterium]